LGEFFRKTAGDSVNGGGFEELIVNALGLNELSIRLDKLVISLKPIATSIQATVSIWGLKLEIKVYMGKLGAALV